MRKYVVVLTLIGIFVACTRVPISGRRQVNLLPESTLMNMSTTSYRDFLSKNNVVTASSADAQMVKRVGEKIKTAVENFMRQKN